MKLLHALLSAALLGAASHAAAQTISQPVDVPDQLRMFLEKETSGVAGRVEVSIGTPDSRLTLAPCPNMQPFIPAGARLWGRTTLGVRCVGGPAWQVFLPANVKVFGQAPVASRSLNAGDSLTDADVRYDEVELTRFPMGALADMAHIADKQLSRPVPAGQPLLRDQFRARQVVMQGDDVKLVYSGPGFAVTTQARALSAATEGQNVRVVTESGKTLNGIARPGRVVEIKG
jgi:flagella basal body P-ring formation protein FlgA